MNDTLTKKELRKFGFLIAFAFPIVFGWVVAKIGGHSFRNWTLWVSFPSLLLAITKPNLLKLPYKLWMKIGYALGWINSRLILGLVFIVVLQPISIFMKLFNYDPLRRDLKDKVISYKEKNDLHKIDLNRIF